MQNSSSWSASTRPRLVTLAVLERQRRRDCGGPIRGDRRGYDDALRVRRAPQRAGRRAWALEGSAATARAWRASCSRHGEWVIEFDRPTRKTKDGAKSDALDAVRAAREMLGRERARIPRAHDGVREAIRVLL